MKFDEIGYWSELKLEIIQRYALAYSLILTKQARLQYVYIDGFSGALSQRNLEWERREVDRSQARGGESWRFRIGSASEMLAVPVVPRKNPIGPESDRPVALQSGRGLPVA